MLGLASCGEKPDAPFEPTPETSLEVNREPMHHGSSSSDYEWPNYLKVLEISLRGLDRREMPFADLHEIAVWIEGEDLITTLTNTDGELASFSCHWHDTQLACHFRSRPLTHGPWLRDTPADEELIPHMLPE